MRIAIPCDEPDLKANVGSRLGTSRYLLVVDLRTNEIEAVPNAGTPGQGSGGIGAVVIAVSKKVDAILTGYCSPTAEKYLSASGITVVTGVSGTVEGAVERYKKGEFARDVGIGAKSESAEAGVDRAAVFSALRRSFNQFVNLVPMLAGIVLLIGLFNALVSREFLASLFSGNPGQDTLWGACFGSIFTGNPINSYIIAGELLHSGISLFAATALIISWVSVGLIQLPAEAGALGRKFALVRNGVSFVLSMAIAFATVIVLNLIRGWFL